MTYTVFRNSGVLGAASLCIGVSVLFACHGRDKQTAEDRGPAATNSAPSGPAATAMAVAPAATSSASGAPPADPVNYEPLRALDREILEWRKTAQLAGAKQKDALPGKAYKVDAYKDEGKTALNRIKIDLDRDGKWDEKWEFFGPAVHRQAAPADDENYSSAYRLDGDQWRKK